MYEPWNKGRTGVYTKEQINNIKEKTKLAMARPEVREKYLQTIANRVYKKKPGRKIGSIPWNKGLTKETDERVKINIERSSITILNNYRSGKRIHYLKGKTREEYHGKEKGREIINKIAINWSKSVQMKPNKLEMKFTKFLEENFPGEWKYSGDGYTWIDGKCPDFLNINGKRLLIELFGDYWHKDDDSKERIEHFKKYNFDTIIIWESEFNNSEELVKNKISEIISKYPDGLRVVI